MPIDGADGSLAALADLTARRIYIHINNTNPILVEGSPERGRVAAAGWEVAADGMEIVAVTTLLSPDQLEAALRDIGARRYHRLHPFHGLLHGGKCTKGQVQAWALNRYYYQASIPLKDASLIARCDDPALRRDWRSRLVDHDGAEDGEGGIARWLRSPTASASTATMWSRCAACFRRRGSRSMPMCASCARRRCSRPSPPR